MSQFHGLQCDGCLSLIVRREAPFMIEKISFSGTDIAPSHLEGLHFCSVPCASKWLQLVLTPSR